MKECWRFDAQFPLKRAFASSLPISKQQMVTRENNPEVKILGEGWNSSRKAARLFPPRLGDGGQRAFFAFTSFQGSRNGWGAGGSPRSMESLGTVAWLTQGHLRDGFQLMTPVRVLLGCQVRSPHTTGMRLPWAWT